MSKLRLSLAAIVAAMLLPGWAAAQSHEDELRRQIGAALQQTFGDSSRGVVIKLMDAKPAGGLQNFDVQKVSRELFGRTTPNSAPDCQSTKTAAGEPDEGECVLAAGDRDSPAGAYTSLMFSKTIGVGNVQFLRRAPFDPNAADVPKPVQLSEEQAYEQAMRFADLVGVPRAELPTLPKGVKLPVRTLAVGSTDAQGNRAAPIAIMKVVSLQRALLVPGLLTDPTTGRTLNYVLAPGAAMIGVDDAGVQLASIEGWSNSPLDPKIDPSLSKSTASLANEIADDLYAEGVRNVGSLSVQIILRRAYPNPDDPNPPLCPVCGVLLPAVQIAIAPVAEGVVETSEKAWAAPGVVRAYDLVERTDGAARR